MNFLKLLILLKSNLILQIYKHETTKQKLKIIVQSFQWKFIIMCSEIVPRNLPVPRNQPKSS